MSRRNGIVVLLVLGAFGIGYASSGRTSAMNEETRKNLMTAMHGEAFAHAKYLLYADHARQASRPELADLFRRTAQMERFAHFSEEAQLAGIVGDDAANLQDAIAGESYEIDTMYREFADQARAAGEIEAAERFEEIRRDEITHRDAFKAALANLQQPVVP